MPKKGKQLGDALTQISSNSAKIAETKKMTAKARTTSKQDKALIEQGKQVLKDNPPLGKDVKRYKKHNEIKNHSLTKDGRKRFNTMLNPDLHLRLKNLCHASHQSIADVLEELVVQHLESKGY